MKIVDIYREVCRCSDPVFIFNRNTHILFEAVDALKCAALQNGNESVVIHGTDSKVYRSNPLEVDEFAVIIFNEILKGSRLYVFAAVNPSLLKIFETYCRALKRTIQTRLIFKLMTEDDYCFEELPIGNIYAAFDEPFDNFKESTS